MITFEHYDAQDGLTVTVSLDKEDLTLPEVFSLFEDFLKGCGYQLPSGARIGYEYESEVSA